jgi:uncharacterized protein with PIN domain
MGEPIPISRARGLAHKTKKKKVNTYRIRAYHDDCGGELVGIERGQATHAIAPWEHRCEKCGAVGWVMGAIYPMITHE